MNTELWKKSTNLIRLGAVLYYIVPLFAHITNILFLAGLKGDELSYFFDIYNIVGAVGAVIFFLGLKKFKTAVNKADQAYISRISYAAIVLFVGSIVNLLPIPFTEWIVGIINIIAIVIMITSFTDLMASKTFVKRARKGASKLRIAMIWSIFTIIIGWITIIGYIECFLSFISFCLILNGWKTIAKARKNGLMIVVNY